MKKNFLKIEKKEQAAAKKKHWVRLTRVCNNNCIFCLDKEAQNGTVLTQDEIREKFREGRKKKIDQVVLSGGEATIHPEFIEIVKMAKDMGYKHIQVITNGRMFAYRDFLISSIRAGVNEITFSIHGHTEELHDSLTQIKGSFKQALIGLKNALVVDGLIVNQDIVINGMNVENLADILKYFINFGVREFDLLQIIPFGRAWENRNKLFYDIEKALPNLKEAFQFSKNREIFIWTNRFPPRYLEGFEDLIQNPKKMHDEVKGRQRMFEDFLKNGRKMSCRGERCVHCFLGDFCDDLIRFKKEGKLVSKKMPICVPDKMEEKTIKINKKNLQASLFRLLDFFIDNRYFIKSEKCEFCDLKKKCDGAPCDYVIEKGLKILKPLVSGRGKNTEFFLDLKEITKCDLRCIFCFRTLRPKKNEEHHPGLEKIKRNLAEARKFFSAGKLIVTGDEPLNCPDLVELVGYAKKLGFREIALSSTGFGLVDEKKVKELIGAGVRSFRLPIYGHNAKLHDSITGRKGSFSRLIKAVKILKDYPGVEIEMRTLLLKKNYSFVLEIHDYVTRNLGVGKLSFRKLLPRSSDLADYARNCPRYSEIKKAFSGAKLAPGARIELPFCLLPADRRRDLFDNSIKMVRISAAGIKVNDFGDQETKPAGFSKCEKCEKCELDSYCQGVPEAYLNLYGDSEFTPIKNHSKR
ncbi:MAG: radical SAM protein [Candidatus Moranbacteria bacterium]|nr:radical SAM protein [Candidatus Moranbacteria bacterium]